jgi:hypothetical protein
MTIESPHRRDCTAEFCAIGCDAASTKEPMRIGHFMERDWLRARVRELELELTKSRDRLVEHTQRNRSFNEIMQRDAKRISKLEEVVFQVRREHYRARGNGGQMVDASVVADLLDRALAPVGGGQYEETRNELARREQEKKP